MENNSAHNRSFIFQKHANKYARMRDAYSGDLRSCLLPSSDCEKVALPFVARNLTMAPADKRNILRVGLPEHPGETEITPAMVDAVRKIIKDAGGTLTVWAVLHEDVYETDFGDGFYLHVRGIALNSADAHQLAALGGGNSEFAKWHVRSYRLGLKDEAPFFTALWRPEEEFTISQFVAILCEIPPGGTASKLCTGIGLRNDGPLLSLT